MTDLFLWVDSEDSTGAWDTFGSPPYLGSQNFPTDYISDNDRNNVSGVFSFPASGKTSETINSVTLYIYASGVNETNFDTYVNDTNTGLGPPTSWGWVSVDVSSILTSWALIDAATIYFDRSNNVNTAGVDAAYLLVDYVDAALTIVVNTASLATNGQTASLALGEATTLLDTASINGTGQVMSFLMGEVTTLLDTAFLFAGLGDLFRITFENNDLKEFDSITDPDNDLTVSGAAAMSGAYGMEVLIDDANNAYGIVDISLSSDVVICEFAIDPNTLTMGDDDTITVLRLHTTAGGPPWALGAVELTRDSSQNLELWCQAVEDPDIWTVLGPHLDITDAPHTIVLEIHRETSDGQNDGFARWWVDGIEQPLYAAASNLENYNVWARTDSIRFGVMGADYPTTEGTFYIDNLICRNEVPRLNVLPGAVSTGLNTASLAASGQVITIAVVSPVTIPLDTAQISTNGQALTLLPGEATLALDTAQIFTGFGDLFRVTFEPGDLSEFDSVVNPDDDLTVSGAAAMTGALGLEVLVDDVAAVYGQKNFSLSADEIYVSVQFDPNDISMNEGEFLRYLVVHCSGAPWDIIVLAVKFESGVYNLRVYAIEDDVSWVDIGTGLLSNAPHQIDIYAKRSTGVASNNGVGISWMDGVQKGSNYSLDNWDAWPLVNSTRLGVISVDANVDGTFYLDNLIIRNESPRLNVQPGETTIALNTATLNAGGQALSLLMGEATVSLNTALIQASSPRIWPTIGVKFAVDVEEDDLSDFTSVNDVNGDLTVLAGAAQGGTDFGIQILIDDAVKSYGRCIFNTTKSVRYRFYIDPNTLTMGDGDYILIATQLESGGGYRQINLMRLAYSTANGYEFVGAANDDALSWTYWDYKNNITDEPHWIELYNVGASTPTSNDGYVEWWVDGVSQGSKSNIDNYDLWNTEEEFLCEFGEVVEADYPTTDGTFYFDEIVIRDDGQEIGPNPTLVALNTATLAAGGQTLSLSMGETTTLLDTAHLFVGWGDLFRVTFEHGDLSEFDGLVNPDDDLSVSGAAAMVGAYGMEVLIDDTAPVYGYKNFSSIGDEFVTSVRIDLNSLTMADGDSFVFLDWRLDGPVANGFYLWLGYLTATGYDLRIQAFDDEDAGALWQTTPVSDNPHQVTVRVKRATTDVSADGVIQWWIDGVYQGGAFDVDNYHLFLDSEHFRLGHHSSADYPTTQGTFYLDQLVVMDGSPRLTVQPGETTISLDTAQIFTGQGDLFRVTFEHGDLSEFDSVYDLDNDLSVSGTAAMVGASGLEVVIDDATQVQGIKNISIPGSVFFHSFYFDPNGLTMGDTELFYISEVKANGTPTVWFYGVGLEKDGATYEIRLTVQDDESGYSATDAFLISDAPHKIEIYSVRAATSVSSDGTASLYIDGVLKETLYNIDNYDQFSGTDELLHGALWGIDYPGTQGTFYLDQIQVFGESPRLTVVPGETTTPLDTAHLFAGQGDLLRVTFEPGDLSEFDSVDDPHSDLSVSGAAAMVGALGLEVVISDVDSAFGTLNFSSPASGTLVMRMRIDPNSIAIGDGDQFYFVRALDTSPFKTLCLMTVAKTGANLELRGQANEDDDNIIGRIGVIDDAPHTAEIILTRASSDIADDGTFSFYIDGVQVGTTFAFIDNWDRWTDVDAIRAGVGWPDYPTTDGTVYLDHLQVFGEIPRLSVVTGETIVALDTASLVADGQITTIVADGGDITVPVDTAALTAGGQSLSLSLGEATVQFSTAQITTNGQTTTVLANIPLSTAQLQANGQNATIVPGAIIISLETASIQASGQILSLLMGETSIALSTAALQANGQTIQLLVDHIIDLDTALLNVNGQIISLLKGEVTTSLDTAALQTNGQVLSLLQGEATIALDTANFVAGGQSLSLLLGETTIVLSTAQATTNGQIISFVMEEAIIGLVTAQITATGQSVSLQLGEASILFDTADLNAGGQAISLSMGETTVGLNTALLTANGPIVTLVVSGADITIPVSTATLQSTGQLLSLLTGESIVQFSTSQITANGQTTSIVAGVLLNTAQLQVSEESIAFSMGEATTGLSTAQITAGGQVLAIQVGTVTVGLNTGLLTANGQTLAIQTGSVVVNLDTGLLVANGQSTTLLMGEAVVSLSTANLVGAGQVIAFQMGEITTGLNTATLDINGQIITLVVDDADIFIPVDTAAINASGQSISLLTGVVLVDLDTATFVLDGVAITIDPGSTPLLILLGTAQIQASGQITTIVSGEAIVNLATALLDASGQTISMSMGAVTIGLTTAQATVNGQVIIILAPFSGTLISLNTAQLFLEGQTTSIVPGAVNIALDTANTLAIGQVVNIDLVVTVIMLATALLSTGSELRIGLFPWDYRIIMSVTTNASKTVEVETFGGGTYIETNI